MEKFLSISEHGTGRNGYSGDEQQKENSPQNAYCTKQQTVPLVKAIILGVAASCVATAQTTPFTLRLQGPSSQVTMDAAAPIVFDGSACVQENTIQRTDGSMTTFTIDGSPCDGTQQKLIIDGYEYPYPATGNVDVDIYFSSYIFYGQAPVNCVRLGGGPILSGNVDALFMNGTIIPLADTNSFKLLMHNNVWRFEINSKYGDIYCQNGTPFIPPPNSDTIFTHGFE